MRIMNNMSKLTKTTRTGLVYVAVLLGVLACGGADEGDYYPKPDGIMRMEFPDRTFSFYKPEHCPYSFEMPDYFEVRTDTLTCHANIEISRFSATIFMTYIDLDTNNLTDQIEQSHKLAYEHSIMADGIEEIALSNADQRVFGRTYEISGNAASLYQFYLTDSTDHFLRGALYFNAEPNYNKQRPALMYIIEDINHLIETTSWAGISK